MKIAIPSLLLFAGLTATHPATVLAVAPPAAADQGQNDTANNDFSFVRYRADYRVNANATNVKTESYEVLLKTKAAVEKFSQIRLSYSEKWKRWRWSPPTR